MDLAQDLVSPVAVIGLCNKELLTPVAYNKNVYFCLQNFN